MYTNVAHYGGDAHIWSSPAAERLRDAGPHETSEASLCEHHAVTEASDLFHVADVASDWRTFLEDDRVCSECAEAWRSLVGEQHDAEDSGLTHEVGQAQYAAFVEYGDAGQPAHPNCRCVTDVEVSTPEDAREQAGRHLAQGQVEHEFSVEVSGEAAERLAEWLRER